METQVQSFMKFQQLNSFILVLHLYNNKTLWWEIRVLVLLHGIGVQWSAHEVALYR